MKIDYDFLKQILTVMVDNESHFIGTDQLTDKLDLDWLFFQVFFLYNI